MAWRTHVISVLLALLAAATVSIPTAARSDRKAWVDGWHRRPVVLTQTLYSIVYDERSRWLPTVKWHGKVTGLTVATPADTYYQFAARRESESDIVDADPNRVVSLLRKEYFRSMHLDHGAVQDIEPLMLVRYEPGVRLFVNKVQIERDAVRLSLHKDGDDDLATTLTVKWPVPLTKELTEGGHLDAILARFVRRVAQ